MARSTEVVVYDSKPATEWLCDGPVRKVSPRRAHAVLQLALGARLMDWACGRGTAGSEWRFWLQPPGERSRYLVPDLAYVSYERLPRSVVGEEAEEPRVAPDAVFEILSPGDRPALVAHKIAVYLAAGTSLVAIVDPERRTIRTVDVRSDVTLAAGDSFAHEALPAFRFVVESLFAALDDR